MHSLSWTNFHNAKPEIDIVGMEQNTKKDPGGLVVCNCDTNNPLRAQVTIQKLTNASINVSIGLTIPTQIKVFTASTNGTEVTSGTAFPNTKLPTNLWVEGESASTNMRDAKLTVFIAGATNVSDYVNFTVLWVEISSRTSDQVSTDDAARDAYRTRITGGYDLGPLNTGTQMLYGVELVGVVHPAGFKDTIVVGRYSNSARTYLGTNQDTSAGTINNDGADDTSFPDFVDQDPQSNGSHGKVYDLDTPGLGFRSFLPVGSIRRNRVNFKEWTEYGGSNRCSAYYQWYARQSIVKTADPNTWARENGVTGDNQLSQGQTAISWDLQ